MRRRKNAIEEVTEKRERGNVSVTHASKVCELVLSERQNDTMSSDRNGLNFHNCSAHILSLTLPISISILQVNLFKQSQRLPSPHFGRRLMKRQIRKEET